MSETPPIRTILFLAANPEATGKLRLDQEVRDIEECLRRSRHRESFVLQSRWAVRPQDIQQSMLDDHPQIVHFSGHGLGDFSGVSGRDIAGEDESTSTPEGLVFEDEAGQIALVGGQAIASLFGLFAECVECVVLNACYSEKQAHEITQHVPYVIGMNRGIEDRSAITFSKGFYRALGSGKGFEEAFELGLSLLELEGMPGGSIPFLIQNQRLLDKRNESSTLDKNNRQLHDLEDASPKKKLEILSQAEFLKELQKNELKIGYKKTDSFLKYQISICLISIPALLVIFIMFSGMAIQSFYASPFVLLNTIASVAFLIVILLTVFLILGLLYKIAFAIAYYREQIGQLPKIRFLYNLFGLSQIRLAINNWKNNISHTKIYDVTISPLLILNLKYEPPEYSKKFDYITLSCENDNYDPIRVQMRQREYEACNLNLEQNDTGFAFLRRAGRDNLYQLKGFIRVSSWEEYKKRKDAYMTSPTSHLSWGIFPSGKKKDSLISTVIGFMSRIV